MKSVLVFLAFRTLLAAQTVQVFSEFQRIDPFGQIVPQDRSPAPREIISPAAVRNGFTSFHVVVSGPPNTNYFLFVGANPPGIVKTRLYKEHFVRADSGWIPDELEEVRGVGFGVIPDAQANIPGQTTRDYLLDVWVPPDAEPGRRVRVELQLKVGGWFVYPMEIRIQKARVPEMAVDTGDAGGPLPPVDAPVDCAAAAPLAAYFVGGMVAGGAAPGNIRQVIRRNAGQDMALAQGVRSPEVWMKIAGHLGTGWMTPGAEWYLGLRDVLYRRASE